jgi:hypothetical protein
MQKFNIRNFLCRQHGILKKYLTLLRLKASSDSQLYRQAYASCFFQIPEAQFIVPDWGG